MAVAKCYILSAHAFEQDIDRCRCCTGHMSLAHKAKSMSGKLPYKLLSRNKLGSSRCCKLSTRLPCKSCRLRGDCSATWHWEDHMYCRSTNCITKLLPRVMPRVSSNLQDNNYSSSSMCLFNQLFSLAGLAVFDHYNA